MKTTPRILLIMLGMMALLSVRAQSPGFEWAVQCGGESQITGLSVALDPVGNQIITGEFTGTVDFDPGPGEFNLTSSNERSIFIQKLDPAGNLLWAACLGNTPNTSSAGRSVVTDGSGNIYIGGFFRGTLDADPGPGEYWMYSLIKSSALVLKIEPDGDLIWAAQFGDGESGICSVSAVSVDENLNVITVGRFITQIDFDPGPAVYNLTSSTPDNVGDDYIHKLDADGNFTWVKQIKGKNFHYAMDVVTDGIGDIYYCGHFWGTVDFDPSVKGKYNLSAAGPWMNTFISKLTVDGDFVWAKLIASAESQVTSIALTLDPWGDLYVGGEYFGEPDFDPGPGVFNMPADGGDAYILKLTSTGDFIWARHLGDGLGDLKTDAAANVYLNGRFGNTADFDPGDGEYLLTSFGFDDNFVVKLNPAGDILWVTQTGGTGYDGSSALDVSPDGYVYVVGNFMDVVDFNPDGNGIFEMTNTSEQDLFVQKLNPAGGSDCPIPDWLNVSDIGETYATLSWNAVTGATGYYVLYRESLAVEWIESEMVTGNSLVLDDLLAATGYVFRVKTDCESNYSYAFEFVTAGGGCVDEYEPNETAATAAPIAVNSEIDALISTTSDNDWFSFSTTNAAKYIKIMLTNLPADYNLSLCKTDGLTLASSNNPGTTDEIILYNPKKSGSYTIHVQGYQQAFDPVNCYTLYLEVSATPYKSAGAAIAGEEAVNSLLIYPNPASDVLEIGIMRALAGNAELALFNVNGQAVLKNYFKVSDGENHLTLDVSAIPNGLYLFRLVADNEVIIRKVVIRH